MADSVEKIVELLIDKIKKHLQKVEEADLEYLESEEKMAYIPFSSEEKLFEKLHSAAKNLKQK